MKKAAAALLALALCTPSLSLAATCKDKGVECSLGELLELNTNASTMGISTPEHIAILLEIITYLRRIITNFTATSQVSGCVDLRHDLRPDTTDAQTDGEVSTLQTFLTSQRVYSGLVTGYYGPQTARAVYEWQREQSIPDVTEKTGVGKQTRQKIREATCALVQ